MRAVYCIDTSSILEAWARRYPRDIFRGFWDDFADLARSGRAIIHEEVLKELARKDDGAAEWASDIPDFVISMDKDQEAHLIQVMSKFPKIVKAGSQKNQADPFVIALARTFSITVVSQEQRGNENKPQIPWICDQMGVECIDILDLIRVEGWMYERRPAPRRNRSR